MTAARSSRTTVHVLPDTQRSDEAKARQRFHLDATWWQQDQERVPHLQTIHEALWQDRKIQIILT
jgi:hypothetical protein